MTASSVLYILLAAAVVPFILSSWWPPGAQLGLAYDAIILLLLIVDYNLTQRPKFLSGRRNIADRLSIGRENTVTIEVTNQGSSELSCRLRDDSPPALPADFQEFAFLLAAGGRAVLHYNLLPRLRGAYDFGNINIAYRSFLGLFWRQIRIPAGQKVKVFSDLKSLRQLSIKLSHSSELGELRQNRRGQGTDFAGLREYTMGDDSKSIDWKATARRDHPIVRTYEAQQEQVLLILIDAGRMMVSDLEGLSRFDHALNAGLCLALAGLARNDQVGLGIFADRPLLYLPPRRGKAQLKRLLEAVFSIQPKMVEPDYAGVFSYFAAAQKGRCLMAVLTDLTDPTGSQTLVTALAGLSPRHLPFCVTLKDRRIDRIANSTSLSLPQIYQRAVATDLIAQRELALSVLTRRGCLVLDSAPQELSGKIVERYLDIKARARL